MTLYHCAMHPELTLARPGACPECGLTLTVHAERPLGFERHLERITFEEARERVSAALKEEGFGVLTEIDVKDTLKKKINVEFRRYVILGACNPKLAHRALEVDPQVGLLLPCNVVLQDSADGGVDVSVIDPRAMFTLSENPALLPIVDEADQRLRRVIAALG
jgi:uncharacterized protein (DUF302 family)